MASSPLGAGAAAAQAKANGSHGLGPAFHGDGGEAEEEAIDAEMEALRARVAELEAEASELREREEWALCQICMSAPRDTVLLPCMDFLYCSGCLHAAQISMAVAPSKRAVCPACDGAVAGMLQCKLKSMPT
jgi:hypothetical protein